MQSLYQPVLPARWEIKKKKSWYYHGCIVLSEHMSRNPPNLAAAPFIAGRAHAAALPAATNMGFFPHYGGWWWGGGWAGRKAGGRAGQWAEEARRENEEKADVAEQIRCWWSIPHRSNKADPLWPQAHWSWKWKEASEINEGQRWQRPGCSFADLALLGNTACVIPCSHCSCRMVDEMRHKGAKYVWLLDLLFYYIFCDGSVISARPETTTDKVNQLREVHLGVNFINCLQRKQTRTQTFPT